MSESVPSNHPTEDLQFVEAALFIGAEPTTAVLLDLGADVFRAIIAKLNERYELQQRPYRIDSDGSGWRMRLLPEYADWVRERMGPDRSVKLGRPALEVLASVAYRQPISRAGIEALTSADAGGALRRLIRMRLVESSTAGDGAVFRTTQRFLDVFHLNSPADLPTVER